MQEEALVLCGDERIDDMGRNVIVFNKYAPSLSDFLDKVAVAAENAKRDL